MPLIAATHSRMNEGAVQRGRSGLIPGRQPEEWPRWVLPPRSHSVGKRSKSQPTSCGRPATPTSVFLPPKWRLSGRGGNIDHSALGPLYSAEIKSTESSWRGRGGLPGSRRAGKWVEPCIIHRAGAVGRCAAVCERARCFPSKAGVGLGGIAGLSLPSCKRRTVEGCDRRRRGGDC